MWVVAKIKPNCENIFVNELKKKIGEKTNFYLPKILLANDLNKKIIIKIYWETIFFVKMNYLKIQKF